MKKLTYLLMSIFIIAAIASCSKEAANENEMDLLKKATAIVAPKVSNPESDGHILPYLIPGANNGGNRTCAEVVSAFTALGYTPNFVDCGEKLNYGDFDSDGDYEFDGTFPEWLDVTVTGGKFVSFTVNNSGATCYRVGAVIVKGSANANVYFYDGGTSGDSGLASPINASGNPAGLSNLTFCYVECEKEPIVLAIKCFYHKELAAPEQYSIALSSGDNIFTTTNWCRALGINYYPNITTFDLIDLYSDANVGMVTIEESGNNLIVTITLNEDLVPIQARTYLYAGSLEGLTGGAEPPVLCPAYAGFWHNPTSVVDNVATFIVPY